MLMHHADAFGDGIFGGTEMNRFTIYLDRATAGAVHARQGIHQGAFARPIFTEQGMNLAWFQGEINVIICQDSWKTNHDVGHFNGVCGHGFVVAGSGWMNDGTLGLYHEKAGIKKAGSGKPNPAFTN
jgi:hypothetical protein